jgi:hypothetical protein
VSGEMIELPEGMTIKDFVFEQSQPTGALRWLVTGSMSRSLQQQFRVVRYQGAKVLDYRDEWRDVPMEFLTPPPSEPSRP